MSRTYKDRNKWTEELEPGYRQTAKPKFPRVPAISKRSEPFELEDPDIGDEIPKGECLEDFLDDEGEIPSQMDEQEIQEWLEYHQWVDDLESGRKL